MFFSDGKEFEPSSSSLPCRHFEFPEILIATENFDESLVIGKGGFGKVYKGNVVVGESSVTAAVKRLDSMSNQGEAEFWAEVEMLSKLRHCNLVSLIGYCSYEKERILVYEYMPNGTLDDHLHKLCSPISWLQRLNICIGAGRGLHYLHTGTGIQSGVIHRDVKSSNILLHESWAAKISDFGLSRIGPTNQPSTYVNTLVKGTFGYLDPDYFTTGRLTRKSDVYAFGVVLLELLCRKRAVDKSLDEEHWGLVTWAQDSIREGNLKNIIDSDIRSEISPKCLKGFVRIAERCLHNSPKQRPTMAEVLFSLESALALQEKFNNSLRSAGKTIFARMVNLLPLPSNKENIVQDDLKLSSNSKGNNINTLRVDNMFQEIQEVPADSQSPSVKEFKFGDLKRATRDFTLLGKEGFGNVRVYLGWVDQNTLAPSKQGDGIAIAVKRITVYTHEEKEEVNLLTQLAHPNIIRLLGCCSHEQEHLIVYEYMLNKSLNDFLFIADGPAIAEPLSWGARLWIMIGVARGLTYLHSRKLVHGDFKSSKILLDEDFNAKLEGHEIVKYGFVTYVATMIHDEEFFSYLDPEYIITGHLTTKSNIYSFGVVLLESLTGQKEIDLRRKGQNMEWSTLIRPYIRNVKKIMDPRLKRNYPPKGASECFALALRCTERNPKDRPSSEEVLQTLEQIYALHK